MSRRWKKALPCQIAVCLKESFHVTTCKQDGSPTRVRVLMSAAHWLRAFIQDERSEEPVRTRAIAASIGPVRAGLPRGASAGLS